MHKCRHRTWKQGRSYVKLHEFDECSEPCPEYKRLKWARPSLEAILRSPSLIGHLTTTGGRLVLDDNGEPIVFASPLIRPETYADLQEALDKRTFRKVRTNTQSLLLGIAFCDCGMPYYRHASGSTNSAGKYYEYDNYRERDGEGSCRSPGIKATVLDDLVTRELLLHLGPFEILERLQSLNAADAARGAELKIIGMQLVQLTQEVYVKGTPGPDHMEKIMKLQARHRELSEAETTEPDAAILRPTGQTFRERWEGTDALDRRMWMLETGVQVIARRKRWPKLDLPGGPLGPETMGEVPRSILGEDGDTYAAILLGDMADLLRRVSAA